MTLDLVELGPDDPLFASWCGVWAAAQRADRPDDPPRLVEDHAALARQLPAPGGSRDGTHRAAVADREVVGALRTILGPEAGLALRPHRDAARPAAATRRAAPRGGRGRRPRAQSRRRGGDLARPHPRGAARRPGPARAADEHRRAARRPAGRGGALGRRPPAGATRDGRLVACTDLHVPLAQPERAHQGGTLVLRGHRGHRLGALVKAAVLRDLLAAFPQVRRVTTYDSESSTPMVAVNEALGFLPAGHLTTWARSL